MGRLFIQFPFCTVKWALKHILQKYLETVELNKTTHLNGRLTPAPVFVPFNVQPKTICSPDVKDFSPPFFKFFFI